MNDLQLAKKFVAKAASSHARGIGFDLSFTSYKNLMRAKRCFYTGVELTNAEGSVDQRTIDRIDNTKGYTKGNVVACCFGYNQIKSVMEKDGLIHSPIFKKALSKMFKKLEEVKNGS